MSEHHGHRSHEQLHQGDADAAVTRALDRMKLQGERITSARKAIVEVLASQVDHLSADDIANDVAERNPEVHRATVYRTLDKLEEFGLLSRLPSSTGGNLYHLLTMDERHHHLHVQCRKCHIVIHVPEEAFSSTIAALQPEFALEPSYSSLMGLCPHCASASN